MTTELSKGEEYTVLDYDQVKLLKDDPNYILIDVRQPNELIEQGSIMGAINIPCKLLVYF